MTAVCLRAVLAGADDGVALAAPLGHVSYAQLRALQPACIDVALGVSASVALRLRSPMALARAVVALDGRAEQILLLSYDTPQPVAAQLIAAAGAGVLLSDEPFTADAAQPVVAWSLDEIALPAAGTGAAVPTRWVLATSGTTGTPKLVAHTFASLTRTATRGGQGGVHRWGQVYNMCRFAGTQVALQALVGGSTLLLAPLDEPLPTQVAWLAEAGVTALSATPTLWRKILMAPEASDLAPRQITLGGEIVDDGVLTALAARFPTARIVHIYASTEAGAAFSVKDRRAGFPAAYLAAPIGGVELKVADGRLYVRNGEVRPAYLGAGARFVDDDGFVDTGDMVSLEGDRVLFLGRAGGMINVGGNKLYPEEVERVLLDHPNVRFARVSAKKSPIVGQLVTAEIVPADAEPGPTLREALIAHCRQRLETWKTPATIKFVEEFESNAGGKLARGAT